MSQPTIKVEGLWKDYTVGPAQQRNETFYDLLANSIKAPFNRMRNFGGKTEANEQFWALRDVNFEIQPGEVVGVVGRNGAGKSTLLKILSRITAPSRGRIELRGRLASLLEVGTGFHAELSGRENIFLNGSILGMTRAEVKRKFDEIVAFAEVDKFIDTPVKRYSSGMYVRLAFAVAAHLETDVLLVDEVLAVGDADFQRKSLGKMSEVAAGGRTVLFVSHNLSAVRNLCSRTVLLEGGALKFDGVTADALSIYEHRVSCSEGFLTAGHFDGPLAPKLIFEKLSYIQDGEVIGVLDPKCEFFIELRGVAQCDLPTLDLNIAVYRNGFHITSCFDTAEAAMLKKGPFVSRFRIPADVFRTGRYSIGVGAVSSIGSWVWGADVSTLDFRENLGKRAAHQLGVVGVPHSFERVQW